LDRIRLGPEKLSTSQNKPTDATSTERWLLVDGLRVRFQRAGEGPAMVLVHGLLGYSFSWRYVLPAFAQHREVFAPDMPGSGFSDCGPNLDCRLRVAAHRLLAFLDEAGIQSCDLLGTSYGGTTAMMAAAFMPQRVGSLTLVAPANPWSRYGRNRLALFRLPGVSTFFPIAARPFRPLRRCFLQRLYAEPSQMTAEALRGYSAPIGRSGVLEHAAGIARSWGSDMDELKTVLPGIAQIPTLLIWGNKDRAVDPASAEPLRRHFQNSQFVVMDGVGHLPYEEEPEQFGRIVMNFLLSGPGAAASTHQS